MNSFALALIAATFTGAAGFNITYADESASGVKQLASVNGPRTGVSDTTSYLYTAAGYLSRVTNAVGHQINVTAHDGMGRPLSVTDANGVVTAFVYNARGWLTSATVQSASGNAVTAIEYSLAGDVTKVTLPDASFLAYTYSDARRLTAITNQIGEKIEFTYDLMGNVTDRVTKDAGGTIKRAETRVHDELGRIIRLIGAVTQTTRFGYDNNSNLTSLTDALNKATSFGIDALNRTTTATNPLMGVRTTAYDPQDNVTSESDERAIATSYVLNGFGEAIQEASPDGGTIVYVRDSAGNVTQKTDARGQIVQYSYDALNRATAATYTGAATFNITYAYDSTAGGNFGIGRLTSVTDVSGTTAIKYDHRGNTVQEDRTIGGTLYTTAYTYDLADNLLTLTYPSGRILTYTRDALGRVTSVTTKANSGAASVNVATAIAYMPFGPIASLTHGNALAATFTWDQDYRLSALKTEQGAIKIQDLAYAFNLDDNVTGITDNLAAARNQTFILDDLQRLTAATGIYGSLSYGYDAADNRLTRNLTGGPSETFTYGTTSNRLQTAAVTGQPARTFTHDAAGNVTLDDRGAGNTVTITIGADDRPQTIAVAGAGATTVSYKHNAFGERVSRVEGAATTHFHYDLNGTLIAESDGAGILIREYLWLGTKPLGLVVGPAGSPTLYFVHADHLDRVQKITDGAQALAWDGQFTPYGRTHAIAGTVQNPLRFPGQWADPAAGYFYNYMRDYDPTLARYLSVDPLGTGGGRNKYTYAGANPQNLIDAFGLQKGDIPRNTSSILQAPQSGLRPTLRAQYGGYLRDLLEYRPGFSVIRDPQSRTTQEDVNFLLGLLREARITRGCEILPNQGIYVLPGSGTIQPYVGQSGILPGRVLDHLYKGNLLPAEVPNVFVREVQGGRTQREIMEQIKIIELGGIPNLRNELNPIGISRQHLLGPLPWRR